jgi:hypothetical protein
MSHAAGLAAWSTVGRASRGRTAAMPSSPRRRPIVSNSYSGAFVLLAVLTAPDDDAYMPNREALAVMPSTTWPGRRDVGRADRVRVEGSAAQRDSARSPRAEISGGQCAERRSGRGQACRERPDGQTWTPMPSVTRSMKTPPPLGPWSPSGHFSSAPAPGRRPVVRGASAGYGLCRAPPNVQYALLRRLTAASVGRHRRLPLKRRQPRFQTTADNG